MKPMGLLEKLSMLSMHKLIPMLPQLSKFAHLLQQPQMPQDLGYSPIGQLQAPEQLPQQEGILPLLLQGGAEGLGSLAGGQLGGLGLDALSGLGQQPQGNDLTKLLELIPEEELRRFLEMKQMRR